MSSGKVKSFNLVGKKPLSKKELEKAKKQQEEEEAAAVYKEFVEAFDKPSSTKLFVLGSVINSGHEGTGSYYSILNISTSLYNLHSIEAPLPTKTMPKDPTMPER